MIKKIFLCFLCLSLFLLISDCKKSPPTSQDIEELIKPTIEYFNAFPSSIKLGDSSTLSWSTTNATTVSISQGIGAVSAVGMADVYPNESVTYTLTAKNNDGTKTSSCTVIILRWAELVMSTIPVGPIFYGNLDGSCTSDFTVITTETNGVGGRIDTIRMTGSEGTCLSDYAQAFGGGTFSANGNFSRYCSMWMPCWPTNLIVAIEGVDMNGYIISQNIWFVITWFQNRGTMSFLKVVYGPNHHKRIK